MTKKILALMMVCLLVLPLAACGESGVSDEITVYDVKSDIHSLDIRIGAAEFTVVTADAFSVESNLKYLSVTEEDGVLSVIEENKRGIHYTDAVLTIYMPETVFESIEITTGAAKLSADALHGKKVKLQLGAGDVEIAALTAEENAVIAGGAGRIDIGGGSIRDLKLEMGVGSLWLTAALPGESKLTFGVGESKLTLVGSKEDYKLDIEEGLGSITVAGADPEEWNGDTGENHVKIRGGVGQIELDFVSETEEE